ncbi:MAG: metal-dependent transcriptional regulator [Candidatus Micrarchaeaceae archaeon]
MKITEKERDCLFAAVGLSSDFPSRLNQIAKELNIKPSTALSLLKRMEVKGLVKEAKGNVILTDYGRKSYKGIMLAHRSLETLFCRMGIPVSYACGEAKKIDYLIGPTYARKLWNFLGKPKNCPHGKPVIVGMA